MQITFTLTKDNYWRCWRHLLKPMDTVLRLAMHSVMTFVLVLISCYFFGSTQALQIAFVASLVIFGADVSTALRSNKRQFERYISATPGLLGQQTLSLSPRGTHRLTSISNASVDWKGYTKIDQSQDGISFYMGPSMAYCVPADAFSSVGEGEAFYQKACDYWEAAKSRRQISDEESTDVWPPPMERS